MAAALLLTAGLAGPLGPTAADIQALESVRVLEPLGSAARSPNRRIAEFAPEIETRDMTCLEGAGRGRFVCRYEALVSGMLPPSPGAWEARSELVRLNAKGRWVLDGGVSANLALRNGCRSMQRRFAYAKVRCDELKVTVSGESWLVQTSRADANTLGGDWGASVSRWTGRVESVWVHE